MSISIQKSHPYTEYLNSQTPGDSKVGEYILATSQQLLLRLRAHAQTLQHICALMTYMLNLRTNCPQSLTPPDSYTVTYMLSILMLLSWLPNCNDDTCSRSPLLTPLWEQQSCTQRAQSHSLYLNLFLQHVKALVIVAIQYEAPQWVCVQQLI